MYARATGQRWKENCIPKTRSTVSEYNMKTSIYKLKKSCASKYDNLGSLSKKINFPEALGLVSAQLFVKRLDGLHVFLAQLKIEHLEVLLESRNSVGLGDDHTLALNSPPKRNLRCRLVVLVGNFLQSGILNCGDGSKLLHIGSSPTQRRVGSD